MTGEEIKALAELHTEDLPIEDDQALAFINECLFMDLGKDAGVISSEEITVSGDSWTTMQTSFLDIIEIEKNGDTYYGRKYGESRDGLFDIKSKISDSRGGNLYNLGTHYTHTLTDLGKNLKSTNFCTIQSLFMWRQGRYSGTMRKIPRLN